MQRFSSPGWKILKVAVKSRGADGKPRDDCIPRADLGSVSSAGSVSPGSALPCPEPRSARLKWQWAQEALSFPLTRVSQTYRPLLWFIRMWTLSKEPDTSDGMKAPLSTEGVKKSQLENSIRQREKTRVCFNYGCSTGSRAKRWLNTPEIQWEEETGEIGLQIQHTTFIRFTQGLQRSRIHPSGEQTLLPCQGKRNYTFIKTKGHENSLSSQQRRARAQRGTVRMACYSPSTLTLQGRCISFTCLDAEVLFLNIYIYIYISE